MAFWKWIFNFWRQSTIKLSVKYLYTKYLLLNMPIFVNESGELTKVKEIPFKLEIDIQKKIYKRFLILNISVLNLNYMD